MPPGWTDKYPYTDTAVEFRVFVKVLYQGNYELYSMVDGVGVEGTDWHNASKWIMVGSDGPHNLQQFTACPKLSTVSEIDTIHQWSIENWGSPTIKWFNRSVSCYDYQVDPNDIKWYDRKYRYTETDITQNFTTTTWGLSNHTFDEGTHRYSASVTYKGNKVATSSKENSTRVSVRRRFSSVTDEHTRKYLQFLFEYLNVPYEYGGLGFGGKESLVWETGRGYDNGYGVDCSGLVSCAAEWAEYNWNSGYGYKKATRIPLADTHGPWDWAYSTQGLSNVTTAVNKNDIRPGDILLKAGSHVVTVYRIDDEENSDNVIGIIEAAGSPDSVVQIVEKSLNSYIQTGFIIRRLVVN